MASGHWPWPLAMGIRAFLGIRASGQTNSAIRAILAIRAIQASGHPGIRKPPGVPMGHRGPDAIDRPGEGDMITTFIQNTKSGTKSADIWHQTWHKIWCQILY